MSLQCGGSPAVRVGHLSCLSGFIRCPTLHRLYQHVAPMEFNHLHFYVDDVGPWRDRFLKEWGGTVVDLGISQTVLIYLGQVPLLFSTPGAIAPQPGRQEPESSPDNSDTNPIATYLRQHPPGIGDVALRVADLDQTLGQVRQGGGQVLQSIQVDPQGRGRWCQVQGWGNLRHTLVQTHQPPGWVPGIPFGPSPSPDHLPFDRIDHAVLNVAKGELSLAADWYIRQLGFQPQQRFAIDTAKSGLRSQVLAHPHGGAQIPVNESTTVNSQVEEFLYWNRGAGVQHVALHTGNILRTVGHLRWAGVQFLEVPPTYYDALPRRQGFQPDAHLDEALAELQILVDWEAHLPQVRLLQTFTQPFLAIPTVFFEIIQRQVVSNDGVAIAARGFGERNFQALFEAIEREQAKRGSLAFNHDSISQDNSPDTFPGISG